MKNYLFKLVIVSFSLFILISCNNATEESTSHVEFSEATDGHSDTDTTFIQIDTVTKTTSTPPRLSTHPTSATASDQVRAASETHPTTPIDRNTINDNHDISGQLQNMESDRAGTVMPPLTMDNISNDTLTDQQPATTDKITGTMGLTFFNKIKVGETKNFRVVAKMDNPSGDSIIKVTAEEISKILKEKEAESNQLLEQTDTSETLIIPNIIAYEELEVDLAALASDFEIKTIYPNKQKLKLNGENIWQWKVKAVGDTARKTITLSIKATTLNGELDALTNKEIPIDVYIIPPPIPCYERLLKFIQSNSYLLGGILVPLFLFFYRKKKTMAKAKNSGTHGNE